MAAMDRVAPIIAAARANGQRMLSEHDGKRILSAYGVPVTREILVSSLTAARAAARRIGFPLVLKACSDDAAHKTEKGLVAVGLRSQAELAAAFRRLKTRAGAGYEGDFLVQEMIAGAREVMIGMTRDAQFGPSVMFGLGGIFTEVLQDVVFRIAPLTRRDGRAMLSGIRAHRILGAVRGLPPVDRDQLARSIQAIGRIALDHPSIAAIDVNPLIIDGRRAVAVDALVVLG
jgi:acetate---CoA ligase (ADP-forming) subunit beta